MRTVAVIGIKTNNVRLPGKNTRKLGGVPLYEHVWKTVKVCKNLQRIIIDSSDDAILSSAKQYGFDIHRRSPELNGPETSGHDLIQNVLPVINEEAICQIFVTTPFIKAASIDRAVTELEKQSSVDSIVPVYPVYDRFWCEGQPVSHDPSTLVGTQFMRPLFREAGFYLFRAQAFRNEGCRVTKRKAFVELTAEECIDIDTELDFITAEAMLHNKSQEVSR